MKKQCKNCHNDFNAYSTLDKYCYNCAKAAHKSKTKKKLPEPKSRTLAKTKAKKRDFYKCQLVGFTNNGHHSNMMHAHHIIYLSQNGTDELWNLITLCDVCHRMVHTNKRYWQPKLLRLVGGSDWYNRIPDKESLPYNVQQVIRMYAAEAEHPGDNGYIAL